MDNDELRTEIGVILAASIMSATQARELTEQLLPLFAARVAAIEADAESWREELKASEKWRHDTALERDYFRTAANEFRERADKAEADLTAMTSKADTYQRMYYAEHGEIARELAAAQERITELIAYLDRAYSQRYDVLDAVADAEERVAAERKQAAAQAFAPITSQYNHPTAMCFHCCRDIQTHDVDTLVCREAPATPEEPPQPAEDEMPPCRYGAPRRHEFSAGVCGICGYRRRAAAPVPATHTYSVREVGSAVVPTCCVFPIDHPIHSGEVTDEPYDPEWVRALIDDRARLQVEVETLQRQADMYLALARKRDTAFAERLTQRVTKDRGLLDRIEAGPAVEGADTTTAVRARLDEHHMFRDQCIGCVRHFGGLHYECAMQPELAALRAVLDLCDRAPGMYEDIREAIAEHIGVTP